MCETKSSTSDRWSKMGEDNEYPMRLLGITDKSTLLFCVKGQTLGILIFMQITIGFLKVQYLWL